jgi:hypothetical protein
MGVKVGARHGRARSSSSSSSSGSCCSSESACSRGVNHYAIFVLKIVHDIILTRT